MESGPPPPSTTVRPPDLGRVDLDRVGRRYWTVRRLTAPARRLLFDVDYRSLENVPATGGVVLAANHLSFIDSMLLMYCLPRPVTFLGKAEYLSRATTRRLFPAAGMIPVDRTGRGVGRSLGHAAKLLTAGGVVGIFPEGTRSRDGRLHAGHTGVAHLALRAGVPIVPVAITGTDAALPPDSRRIRRGVPITVRFGAPIDLGRFAAIRPAAAAKRALTHEVMGAIAAMTGQECAFDGYDSERAWIEFTADTIARSDADTIDSSRPTPQTGSRAPLSIAT